MQIDHCLILAAGLGTRMGKIGKQIPKALWPIFEKTLLELQVEYAKSLGIKNISINCHFLADQIKSFVDTSKLSVQVLEEIELLDVGGAIYNYKAHNQGATGNLLILNSDLFLFMDQKNIKRAVVDIENGKSASLFAIKVKNDSGYNKTCISDKRLVKIVKANEIDDNQDYYTYSGVGLISLDKLENLTGVQKFFETVANFNNLDIGMVKVDSYEYCDFGTLKRYYHSLFGLKDNLYPKLYQFLTANSAFNDLSIVDNEIRCKDLVLKENAIYFNGVVEKLE